MPESTPATATAAPPASTEAQSRARANRKERVGEVISNKMTKTIVVRVQRRFPHPRYKKVVTQFNKLYAHDEKREARIGDRVRIQECRPLSKTKRWRLVEVVERNAEAVPVNA
jgi:small subunit ribosomal protein S17